MRKKYVPKRLKKKEKGGKRLLKGKTPKTHGKRLAKKNKKISIQKNIIVAFFATIAIVVIGFWHSNTASVQKNEIPEIPLSNFEILNSEVVYMIVYDEQEEIQDEPEIYHLSKIDENSTQEERILAEMSYFINEMGWSVYAAAGVTGNTLIESANNPSAKSRDGYIGTAQWSRAWWPKIQKWCINNGYDPFSFEGQIRAIAECPSKGCLTKTRMERFSNLENERRAAEYFAVFYEGCLNENGNQAEWYSSSRYSALNLRKSEAEAALRVWYGEPYTGTK